MAIDPFPEATLLPVLRPQSWRGGESALRSKLIRTDEPMQHNLWISFAYNTETKLYTVTKESLKAHSQKSKDIVMEALQNLQNQGFEWEIHTRRGDGSAQVLSCTHEFAAESILLPDHLLEAQSILGVHEIAIALPVAGLIIVQAAHSANRHDLDQLMLWAHENYMQAEGRTLTPNLITAQMGQIRSMYCNPLTDQNLNAEQPVLLPSEYDAENQRVVFRATSAELPLWEIERIKTLLKSQELADGRPVKHVRVVASDPSKAHTIALHLQHLSVEIWVSQGDDSVPFSN